MLQTCIRGAFILKTPLGPKCFHDTAGAIDFTPLHCHFRRGGRSAFIASPPSCDAMLAYASSALCPPSLYCRVVHTLGNDQKRRPVKPSRWLIVISSYNPLVLAAQPRCTRFVFLFVFQSPVKLFSLLCIAVRICVLALDARLQRVSHRYGGSAPCDARCSPAARRFSASGVAVGWS